MSGSAAAPPPAQDGAQLTRERLLALVSPQNTPACGCEAACALPPVASAEPDSPEAPHATRYRIPTMDCAAEEGEIRHALRDLPGLRSLGFALTARTLTIDAPPTSLPAALAALRKAGFKPELVAPSTDHSTDDPQAHGQGPSQPWWAEGAARYALALACAVGAEALTFVTPASALLTAAGMGLAAAAILLAGFSTYAKGLAALRQLRLNINALMAVAVTGAFAIGQWPEAAMVMALYAIAELIEARSVDRARNAIKGLLDMTPQTAERRHADGTWQVQTAATVAVGAIVRIKPGARVPLDAQLLSSHTTVNQAPITGESMPVDKSAGDMLFAGTINLSATVEARVNRASGDTLLARIVHAVEQAQGARAPTQQFVDRFASVYTPVVFTLAVAVATLGPVLMAWTGMQSIYKALVLLVIACPCALVISTPVTVVSALATAARRGILVKGGIHLENARRIKALALDKTGTLTAGTPTLCATDVIAASPQDPAYAQILHWAADMAAHSDHPVAQAIAAGLAEHRCNADLSGFEALPGRGIQAHTHGAALVLGNRRWMEEKGLFSPAIATRMTAHETQGHTVTLLASSTQVLALFAVADTIKASSKDAVAQLRELGVACVMLTGDNPSTAKAIARAAGIDDARGNLLPEDKLNAMAALQQHYRWVAMVGDGINDAPALAQSNIGFAMGGAGTDIAMETADVVIMNDDLRRIPELIRLSQATHTVLWQNIALALGIKTAFLLLAVMGSATMWMAVFADMGASLLVVANGLRLLRLRRQG